MITTLLLKKITTNYACEPLKNFFLNAQIDFVMPHCFLTNWVWIAKNTHFSSAKLNTRNLVVLSKRKDILQGCKWEVWSQLKTLLTEK